MRHYLYGVVTVSCVLYGITLFAESAVGFPSPGYYRTDSEATVTMGSGSTAGELIERVNGATGQRTVIRKMAVDAGHPVTNIYKGEGPVGWCVSAQGIGKSPPQTVQSACNLLSNMRDPRGSSFSADCKSSKVEENWRRVDNKTWERSLKVTPQSSATPDSPRPAFEMAQSGMTPEQRAQAEAAMAALPSAAQMKDAMAPVIDALQEEIRTGSPEEAASARQQLQALRATTNGSSQFVTRVVERWTRIADTCAAP